MTEILLLIIAILVGIILRGLAYENPIIKWNQEDLRKLERRVAKLEK